MVRLRWDTRVNKRFDVCIREGAMVDILAL
jgi:hypothetical protein